MAPLKQQQAAKTRTSAAAQRMDPLVEVRGRDNPLQFTAGGEMGDLSRLVINIDRTEGCAEHKQGLLDDDEVRTVGQHDADALATCHAKC